MRRVARSFELVPSIDPRPFPFVGTTSPIPGCKQQPLPQQRFKILSNREAPPPRLVQFIRTPSASIMHNNNPCSRRKARRVFFFFFFFFFSFKRRKRNSPRYAVSMTGCRYGDGLTTNFPFNFFEGRGDVCSAVHNGRRWRIIRADGRKSIRRFCFIAG